VPEQGRQLPAQDLHKEKSKGSGVLATLITEVPVTLKLSLVQSIAHSERALKIPHRNVVKLFIPTNPKKE